MSQACNYDIKDLLYEWIYEKSFPVLDINFTETKVEIKIEQFPSFGDSNIIFKIPLFIKTKNLEKLILMKEKNIII